jgi:hypothetical protein
MDCVGAASSSAETSAGMGRMCAGRSRIRGGRAAFFSGGKRPAAGRQPAAKDHAAMHKTARRPVVVLDMSGPCFSSFRDKVPFRRARFQGSTAVVGSPQTIAIGGVSGASRAIATATRKRLTGIVSRHRRCNAKGRPRWQSSSRWALWPRSFSKVTNSGGP